jgi:xanthine dehydrogenase YagR molybdenum-binding subunit
MKLPDDERYYAPDGVTETPLPTTEPEPWKKTEIVGAGKPRVDGYARVSGTAVYPSDVVLPGMLYAGILRCPHANARVKKVDTTRAAKMPGVRAVITADSPEADVEWRYGSNVSTKLFPSHCLFNGETVAAVAADTPYQAADALAAIDVEYEVLPFVVDERKALDDGAPRLHEGGNRVSQQTHERGDVQRGFDEADVVLEQSYRTECELHTPLELHGCVARWDGDRLNIWESTQGVYAVQSRTADVLGLPLANVRVIGHYLGGGFGAKLQPGKYTIIAALLAKKSARPVKAFLPREDTYLAVGNRPPANMTLKAGVKRDGTLTALEFSGLGTGGAYPAGGTSLLDWLVRDLYTCPNVRTETTDVYVNAGPARPFRAPGHPQGAWALEQMMDALAEQIGMDPVELRLKNIPTYSQAREGNPEYTSIGLPECLRRGAEAFGWQQARERARRHNEQGGPTRRGVGVAACQWIAGGGGPPSTVIVKLFRDGSANLNMGASDIGTGTKTIMAMVVAEELGVPLDQIDIENADTGTTQYATPSGGSKTVPTEAPAVRDAALAVKEKLLAMAAADLTVDPDELELRNGEAVSLRDGSKRLKINEISGLRRRGVLVGVGHRGPNPENKVVSPFAAQFCEVEVDTGTGEVKVLRFVGAHESGRVMNALTFDNQVFGGITMGIGLANTEQRILDERHTGRVLTRNWHDYKLPTSMDVPPPAEMGSVRVEITDHQANTTGAKGLGEPVTIPTAAAIANAVYDATGVRCTATPLNPVLLAALFADARKETQR